MAASLLGRSRWACLSPHQACAHQACAHRRLAPTTGLSPHQASAFPSSKGFLHQGLQTGCKRPLASAKGLHLGESSNLEF
mmetsp:Transcript_125906/g.326986  ORF Transcript_125906/g.326986 Transcript_125906/m.326986 type:complete len:80 (-) Transcript_125906:86-325(-)